MIAQDVLLGRQRVAARVSSDVSLAGGRLVRVVLGVIVVSVLAFESATVDPLLDLGTYIHRGIGSWTGLPIILSPLEILLIIGLAVSLFTSIAGLPFRADALRIPLALFVVGLVFGVVRGALAGGDPYIALWELRYLLYVPACFVIVRAGMRRPEHVATLLKVGFIAIAAFAIEGAWRKIALINTGLLGVAPEFFYEHEDVIFLASFLVLLVSAYLYRAGTRVRIMGLLASPVLLYTLLASGRRSGIIVLLVGLLMLGLTVLVLRPKAFFATVLPVLGAAALYIAFFWNSTGLLGQPARAVRSLYEPDPRDSASNLYRVIETYDITVTIKDDPWFGVGFGREFNMQAALPDLSWWPFWRYETHNNVLWVWLKTGAAGYVAFWLLVGSAMTRSAFAAKRFLDPRMRAAGIFCLVSLVGVVVFAYVDLGLVSGRVTVFFGTVLGLVSVVETLGRSGAASGGARS